MLLLTAYRKLIGIKSIGTKMNDLDLCLEVVQGHVNHCGVNISKTTGARDFKFDTRLCMGRDFPGFIFWAPKV